MLRDASMARVSWMVPLDLQNAYTVWLVHEFLSNLKRGIGWLTLRRALIEREPGFWGDSPTSPSSVVYMREGDCQVEAFGLFSPRPAVRWLAALERPVALLAPAGWAKAVRVRAGPADRAEVVSWVPGFYKPNLSRPVIPTRRLNLADAEAFAASSP